MTATDVRLQPKKKGLAFWVRDGQVLAGMNANIWDQADGIKALVRSGARVEVDRLADPSVDLGELLG